MRRSPRVHRSVALRGLALAAAAAMFAVGCSSSDSEPTEAGTEPESAASDTGPTEGSDGTDATEGSIRVLTYNVAGLPQEISGENPEVNLPLISPLLAPYDLVLTQEDFDWWKPGGLVEANDLDFVNYRDRVRAEADMPHATPVHPGPEAAGLDPASRPTLEIGDGIGIMARFPLDDFVTQAWEGCFGGLDTSDGGAADCAAMKGFRVATMDLGGVPVDVYSLHAEAGGTDEDQRLQVEDFAQLAAFMADHSGDRAVILGGDTNLHTDGDHDDSSGSADGEIWADFLATTGLTDACDEASCDDPGLIDKIAFRSSTDIALTFDDYVLPRETFTDADGNDLSDHPPVEVTLAWKIEA